MSSVFRKKKKEPLFDSGPQAFNLLMKEAVVKEFLDEQESNVHFLLITLNLTEAPTTHTPATAGATAERATLVHGSAQGLVHRNKRASKIRTNFQPILHPKLQVLVLLMHVNVSGLA
jgi:hypothetical protein